jgi:hypothetical protein
MKTTSSAYCIGGRFQMAFALFILLGVLVTPAYAQNEAAPPPTAAQEETPPVVMPGAGPGTISGRIKPPFGGTFYGATVTLTNEATGDKQVTKTDPEGEYTFKNLGEGAYSVDVEPDGYAPAWRPAVAPGDFADFQVRNLMLWEPFSWFFTWSYNSRVGAIIRDSTWAFAIIEVFHLLGLTVLLGSVIGLALRLANIAMKSLPPREVAREIRPYMFAGLALTVLSGILLFATEAEKLFLSEPFQWKIVFFVLANIFQFTAVAWLARSRDGSSLVVGKVAALLSVVLWYVVGWEGRAIAFF